MAFEPETILSGQAASAPFATLGLAACLIALSWIDLRTFRLPDGLTLPLAASGMALNGYWGGWTGALQAAITAGLAYSIIWLLAYYWRRHRGENGIGLGDAKLFAAGGAWCGGVMLPIILLAASSLGLVFAAAAGLIARKSPDELRRVKIPFGPFLSIGILVGWMLVPAIP